MTQTCTQRHMHEHINKGAKMQTKKRKPNKMEKVIKAQGIASKQVNLNT